MKRKPAECRFCVNYYLPLDNYGLGKCNFSVPPWAERANNDIGFDKLNYAPDCAQYDPGSSGMIYDEENK